MFIGVGGGKNLTESQYCFLRDGGDSIKYNFQKKSTKQTKTHSILIKLKKSRYWAFQQ